MGLYTSLSPALVKEIGLTVFLLIFSVDLFSSVTNENSQRISTLNSHPKMASKCFTIVSVGPRKEMAAWDSSSRDPSTSSISFRNT